MEKYGVDNDNFTEHSTIRLEATSRSLNLDPS